MKNIKYSILCLVAVLFCMTGCKDGVEFSDGLFITGALKSNTLRIAVDEEKSIGITVSSTTKATETITAKIEVAPEMVEVYNKENARNCVLPAADAYVIENSTVTIAPGKAQSNQAKLTSWSDKLEEGKTYCLPLRITQTSGGLDAIETGKVMYILMSKVVNIKVADLNAKGGFDIKTFLVNEAGYSPVEALGAMTLEMKVYPKQFGKGYAANKAEAISSLCGCEENFLFRFGDGGGADVTRLQFVKGSIGSATHPDSKEHYETWTDYYGEVGKWIHFAATYDGQVLKLFIDGEEKYKVNVSKGGTINLATAYGGASGWGDCFSIGRSAGYSRYFDGYVSECRVWNKARTAAELQDGLCYVDPTTDGLIAYWRFNGEDFVDGNPSLIYDQTGHGYTATVFGTINYVANQKCPY